MVSLGILSPLASLTALRRRAFESISPLPPVRAATVISLMSFVKILPRLASRAPFLCLIECHLECPDIMRFLYVCLQPSCKGGRNAAKLRSDACATYLVLSKSAIYHASFLGAKCPT